MQRRYNVGPQPAVVDHTKPAVMPGESHDFTDEQVKAGLAGDWSEKDPREGIEDERAFKKRRDKAPETASEPAQPEKE